MKYPKLREFKEAIKALFKGPYTTKFPFKPHKPFERFRGKPIPDEKECTGCAACAEVCPANAIEVIDDKSSQPMIRRIIWHYDLCCFCAQCERLCTTKKGVKLSNVEFDLSTLDRKTLFTEIKKELVICEFCSEIIATKDYLLYLTKKLKHMTYGNYLLFLFLHQQLGLTKYIPKPGIIYPVKRQNLFRLSCSKCRRKLRLFDEYDIQLT